MKEILLSRGKVALVDDEDFEWLNQWKWSLSQLGTNRKYRSIYYAHRTQWYKNGVQRDISMHRLILDAPKGLEVDHIDGNGLNNQRSNLRLCTRTQNARNARRRKNGSSRFKGVCKTREGRWNARIYANGKRANLGVFKNEADAARAYDAAAAEAFGEFARLNSDSN